MKLKREPALLLIGLIAPTVQAIVAFALTNDPAVSALANGAAAAIAGALTAALVRSDQLVPAITGALQALVALGVGLGLAWTPEQQALLLVPIGMVAAYVVRDRVTAPVPEVVRG